MLGRHVEIGARTGLASSHSFISTSRILLLSQELQIQMSTGHKATSLNAMELVDIGGLANKPCLGKMTSPYLWPIAGKHSITYSLG